MEFDEKFLKEGDRKVPDYDMDSYLVNGELKKWNGDFVKVHSCIYARGATEPLNIGRFPNLTAKEAVECAEAARDAFSYGRGEWPAASPRKRIETMVLFLNAVRAVTKEIAELIMFEIGKTEADSIKEVERSIKYAEDTIAMYRSTVNKESSITSDGGIFSQIRRVPLGVALIAAPFNYPFNETWACLIPALLLGNTVVMKLPRNGVLCHYPTLKLFQTLFPKGVVNCITGSGRTTLPPILASGIVDVLGFIGTSKAASELVKHHPKPNRLRLCLGLEAKNAGIVLEGIHGAALSTAVSECVTGSFSFNGQRCTAIKIIYVHKSVATEFVSKFSQSVDALVMGLPWEKGTQVTPLPELEKPAYIKGLADDAVSKGAAIMNSRGGKIDRAFVAPTVVYPINPTMRLYHEEQFGPIIGITPYEDINDVFAQLRASQYGQQAAVFGSDAVKIGECVDVLVNLVSRVNIMAQCQRGPDTFPFTGRKDSATGTLSVYDALRVFSIRAMVAAKETPDSQALVMDIIKSGESDFLRMDYIF